MRDPIIGIGLSILLLAPACNTPGAREDVGRAQMALTGQGTSGTLYRLRNGLFNITGLQTATVNTEDDPSRTSVSVILRVGGYLATLQPGWHLEKQTSAGVFAPLNAVLVSANPLAFQIQEQAVTQVRFTFNAGNDVIELGHGVAVIGIDVNDCGPAGCAGADADGDGVPVPQDCDDGNPTRFPGAAELCDAQDNDCDGDVDEGGCVPASCNLVAQTGCAAGESCYLVTLTENSCLPTGAVPEGGVCDFSTVNECGAGLVCIGNLGSIACRRWCDLSNPAACPPGFACNNLGLGPQLGACLP